MLLSSHFKGYFRACVFYSIGLGISVLSFYQATVEARAAARISPSLQYQVTEVSGVKVGGNSSSCQWFADHHKKYSRTLEALRDAKEVASTRLEDRSNTIQPEQIECYGCTDSYFEKKYLLTTQCDHPVCDDCLAAMSRNANGKVICGICRQENGFNDLIRMRYISEEENELARKEGREERDLEVRVLAEDLGNPFERVPVDPRFPDLGEGVRDFNGVTWYLPPIENTMKNPGENRSGLHDECEGVGCLSWLKPQDSFPKMTHYEAVHYCQARGAQLPTLNQFRALYLSLKNYSEGISKVPFDFIFGVLFKTWFWTLTEFVPQFSTEGEYAHALWRGVESRVFEKRSKGSVLCVK